MLAFGKNEGEFFYDEKPLISFPRFAVTGKALLSK